jgi:hypothetical protein
MARTGNLSGLNVRNDTYRKTGICVLRIANNKMVEDNRIYDTLGTIRHPGLVAEPVAKQRDLLQKGGRDTPRKPFLTHLQNGLVGGLLPIIGLPTAGTFCGSVDRRVEMSHFKKLALQTDHGERDRSCDKSSNFVARRLRREGQEQSVEPPARQLHRLHRPKTRS